MPPMCVFESVEWSWIQWTEIQCKTNTTRYDSKPKKNRNKMKQGTILYTNNIYCMTNTFNLTRLTRNQHVATPKTSEISSQPPNATLHPEEARSCGEKTAPKSGSSRVVALVVKEGWRNGMPEIDNWLVVSKIFYFHPYLGKIPNLTNIFQRGWNHQLDNFGDLWQLVFK